MLCPHQIKPPESFVEPPHESLADQKDRNLFQDYLLTNLKLYFDRFEEELQPTAVEPESPDYSKNKDADVDMGELGL